MSECIGIGVIGLGMMGQLHSRVVLEHPGARLVGVANADTAQVQRIVGVGGTKGYTDYRRLLDDRAIDAVIVCTPDQSHLEPALAALDAGKHLLVEKPLATDVVEAEAIVAAADRTHRLLMVGHLLRFDPRYAQAFHLIRRGEIGEITHVWTRRNNPRGAARRLAGRTSLMNYLGVHDVDLIRWLTGQEVRTVYAVATSRLNADLGVEDSVFALLRFDGGVVGSLELSWAFPEQMGARIYGGLDALGTAGAVHVDVFNQGLRVVTRQESTNLDTMHWPVVHDRLAGDLREEVHHFIECVRTGTPPLVTGADGLAAVRVAQAAIESIRTGEVTPVST